MMEVYKEITLKQAVEKIANDDLKTLYFKSKDGITCIESWRLDIQSLKNLKWYEKSVKNESQA